MKPTILIAGATGTTGSTAIKTLLELKVRVRALVHKKDARSEQLSTQGVEIVQGDLSDFEAVSEALKGISAAYFVFPIQVPGILESTAFFAQAAIEQGVSAIAGHSQIPELLRQPDLPSFSAFSPFHIVVRDYPSWG
jgi:NAD(P)H dehydrogenase (quinone)